MKNYICMRQVHGDRVVRVSKSDAGKVIVGCDGLITNDPEAVLSVHTADCLPIFIYSPEANSIGVVHAGWRGLNIEIISKAIRLMKEEFGAKENDLTIFIGPYICQKHYEVKNDVSEKFKDYPRALKDVKGKLFLDLGEIAKQQLIKSGVNKNNIQFDGRCTFEEKTLASFRRGKLKNNTSYIFRLPESS
jgi:polyphenol oxidase